MFEALWFKSVSKKKRSAGEAIFFILLVFISMFYSAGLLLRKLFYLTGIKKRARFNAKVICAGNMTVAANLNASSFIVPSGLPTQFLKADGSLDSSAYFKGTPATTTGLTLKTTQYIPVTIAGTTYKLALCN